MAKNIVLCLDGTGNEYGRANTNVFKLYSVLKRNDPAQLTFYDPGVGTLAAPGAISAVGRRLSRLAGLAFGIGLLDNVAEAYRFLMASYERGDHVYVFGFSRGAYTARALGALLFKCGLLARGNDQLVPYALKMLRRNDARLAAGFRRSFGRRCSIHFLGLWDTVKSVGRVWDPLTLQFTMWNPIVKHVRHAIAIDERRCYYRPNAWGPCQPHQIVKQVWFAGAHADVGGGYPEAESGLAKIALSWMATEAADCGLLVDPRRLREVIPSAAPSPVHDDPDEETSREDDDAGSSAPPDPLGRLHTSLSGPWWLLELLPKRYQDPRREYRWRWHLPLGRPRFIPDGAVIHRSVAVRAAAPALGYRPPNLPARPVFTD